jgi:hypothetical protein
MRGKGKSREGRALGTPPGGGNSTSGTTKNVLLSEVVLESEEKRELAPAPETRACTSAVGSLPPDAMPGE